ncbi:MAG: signal recognition particle-docking protein FtsY, partial [Puniceicoccales bacterium]|jgi:fused signal recognition particle receptor|nr:signal recognition particle-docking protein FtsY [Puniceicoccales bacterium]
VVKNRLYEQLENADGKLSFDTDPPQVVVLLGVNGVGKTTTAAKIAAFLKKSNQKVLLGSCDTFRAAANEQLRLWAERLEIDFVGSQHGSDAAAVAFDSCRAAIARCCDVVILDTAGRLHTKSHLMEELKKLVRVVKRSDERIQPHRWIVIDGSIGTNSLEQAQTFHREIGLTGMVMTKLDGSGRGGAIANIYRQLQIPVYFVGLGENPEDLQPFSARAYVDTLFDTV